MNTCLCEKDQDGQCEPCKSKLGLFYDGMMHIQKMFFEQIDRLKDMHNPSEVCPECRALYSDAVMAKFMGMLFDVMPNRVLALQMYLQGLRMLLADGAAAAPHLERAWRAVCEKNGWDPSSK